MSEEIKIEELDTVIARVRLDDLSVGDYQRELTESWVKKLEKNWNDRFVGIITVGARDNGVLYIIDGQHRVEAAKRIGKKHLFAKIITTSSKAEEASIFTPLNTSKTPTAIDKFHADCVSGAEDALEIFVFLDDLGLFVPKKAKGCTNGVSFINSLRKTWATDKHSAKTAISMMNNIRGDLYMEGRFFIGLWYLLSTGLQLEGECKRISDNGCYARALRNIRNGLGGVGSGINSIMRRSAMYVLDAINHGKRGKFEMPEPKSPGKRRDKE